MPKVETKLLENRQATLTVEVEPERVERALKAAARKIARQVAIPGFRKGKAPYHIIVQQFGEEAIYDEALDPLGQQVYKEALEQSELEPYAPGSLDEVQWDPAVLTFTVPLRPEVDLKDYRKVRVKGEKIKVTKQEIADALEAMRESQAVLEPVERAAALGDVVTLDLKGTLLMEEGSEPETLIERQGAAILIEEDGSYPLPGFGGKVVGIQEGEERTFILALPEDFFGDEEQTDKEASFEVKCLEVKRRELPDLDDEFAQSVGDFENLKELHAHVEEDLEAHKKRHADEEQADEALEKIIEKADLSYPPIMIDEWIDGMVRDLEQTLKRQQNLTLEDYFSITESDAESLREDFREDAERNLQRALVMGRLVEAEHLSVDDSEISDGIETMLLAAGQQAALARHFLQSEQTKDEVRNTLLVQKIRERLVAIAGGDAPPLDALEAEAQTESDTEGDTQTDPS